MTHRRPTPTWPCSGVRVATPVRRPAGAGPCDDGHVVVDGRNAALPINPASPYSVDRRQGLARRDRHRAVPRSGPAPEVLRPGDGRRRAATSRSPACTARTCSPPPSSRPASGTPRTSAAGSAPSRSRCGPAAPSPPRRRRSWPRSPRPRSRLDGVTQMVMTTGTTTGPDRGARNLVRCGPGGPRSGARPAHPGADRAAARPRGHRGPARRGRGLHRHPRRVARRRRAPPVDARQGQRPDGRVRGGLGPRRRGCSAATRSPRTC